MKSCARCGARNVEMARFCAQCGTGLDSVPPGAAPGLRSGNPAQQEGAEGFTFFCKACGRPARASLDWVGRLMACPACQSALTVPGPPQRGVEAERGAAQNGFVCAPRSAADPAANHQEPPGTYKYVALTQARERVTGLVQAASRQEAIRAVERLGYFPVTLAVSAAPATPVDRQAEHPRPAAAPRPSAPATPPSVCPLCGKAEHMRKAKSVYEHWVCGRCSRSFANRRQAAYVLDYFASPILALPFLMVLMIPAFVIVQCMSGSFETEEEKFAKIEFLLPLFLTLCFLLKDGFLGYSFGKWVCGLRVMNEATGKPAGFVASFKRNLPLLIPIVPLVVMSRLMKGYRVGDGWAKTKVVWTKYAASPLFQ